MKHGRQRCFGKTALKTRISVEVFYKNRYDYSQKKWTEQDETHIYHR
jgi:hypothetical protein